MERLETYTQFVCLINVDGITSFLLYGVLQNSIIFMNYCEGIGKMSIAKLNL